MSTLCLPVSVLSPAGNTLLDGFIQTTVQPNNFVNGASCKLACVLNVLSFVSVVNSCVIVVTRMMQFNMAL